MRGFEISNMRRQERRRGEVDGLHILLSAAQIEGVLCPEPLWMPLAKLNSGIARR
jgi:hypothetical protein